MTGDGVDVDRCIARTADGGARNNRVLERVAGENVGRFQILAYDLNGPPSGLVGDLPAFPVRRGNGGAAR